MVSTVSVNPILTGNAPGTFKKLSDGFIQGMAMDDPATRNALAGGVLSVLETLPMWGGVGITELIAQVLSQTTHSETLGNDIRRATGIATALPLTGFSVLDQNHSAIITQNSQVPLVLSGMTMNFYRLGSGARVPVKCSTGLVSAARGGAVSQQVSWDFTAQQLVPFSAAYAQGVVSGAVWSNTAGGQVQFTINVDLTAAVNAGDVINVSGVVNTGGASTGAFNGTWVVVSVDDATHVTVAAPASATIGTFASNGVLAAGGGALPVRLIAVRADNCMTVNYSNPNQSPNPGTGFATWNYDGACALIELSTV